jgi:hypothetical protein
MIGIVLSKEWKDVDKKNYMKLAKEEEGKLFFRGVEEVKLRLFKL